MKILLFSFAFSGFIIASSQTPYYDFKKFQEEKILSLKQNKIAVANQIPVLNKFYNYFNPQAILLFTQPNGNKVYSLPKDNMICLVPDLSNFNMPNIAKNKIVQGMPPGRMLPFKIIPQKNP